MTSQPANQHPTATTSLWLSASLALGAVLFGVSRDIGTLLLEMVILLVLLFFALSFLCAAWIDDKGGRAVKISMLLFILSPFLAYTARREIDEIQFIGWSIVHFPQLFKAASEDRVIARLDSWGFGGLSNDSFVVSDAVDNSSTVSSADRWRIRMGLDCEVVATSRMWAGFYVLTTSNCGFDDAARQSE